MNIVKLAQFYGSSNEETKFRLLQQIDISYCIPDEPRELLQCNYYGGYNCLHFAVKSSHLNLVNELLNREANFMKQGTYNQKTPLHEAHCNSYYSQNYEEKLNNNNILYTLLSAQAASNKSLNPKCNYGITHLHIACIADHTEAVSLFLKNKQNIHQTLEDDKYDLKTGFTALHCAVKYASVQSVEILLKYGADIHLIDANGVSPLDLLIQRLLNMKDFVRMGERAICYQYQKQIQKLESVAKSFLEARQPDHANYLSDTGLSTLHLACTLTDPSIGAKFLKRTINVNESVKNNSQMWPGCTPLHFAACSNDKMFKLLVQSGADISIKNARGQTPIDLLMMRFDPEIVHSILSVKNDIKNILMSDGATKMLDLLLAMNDCDTFQHFLESLKDVNISVPVDSPIWSGYSALHIAIKLNDKIKIQDDSYENLFLEEGLVLLPEIYNCTEEDEKKYWKRIVVCLSKLCSIKTKNADNLSPIHLAFNLYKEKAVSVLLNTCHDNIVDSNNLSILHIACAVGKKNVVERLLNKGADMNIRTKSRFMWFGKPFLKGTDVKPYLIPVRANSTPLHVAVVFENKDIMAYLIQKGADLYVKDELGLTPIHLTMAAFRETDAPSIIQNFVLRHIIHIKESVSNHGLTHLHAAAYADDERCIKQLIQEGADVNALFEATVPKYQYNEHPPCDLSFLARYVGMTPLRLAVLRGICGNAIRSLIQNGADIFFRNSKGESALNSMMDRASYSFVEHFINKLKQDRRIVAPIDPNGITLLHIACATLDFDWAKQLLKKGANANAQIKVNDDDIELNGNTPLSILIFEATMPSTVFENLENFVKLLLKYGADVTIMFKGHSPLHAAFNNVRLSPIVDYEGGVENDDEEEDVKQARAATMLVVADLLVKNQKSYKVNPTDKHGFSHFHYACSRDLVDIVKKFVDNGIDVNLRVDPFSPEIAGWTPLHFVFKYRSWAVARLLIARGANMEAEDSFGNTPVFIAIQTGNINLAIFNFMLRKGADFNAKSLFINQRPIDCLLKVNKYTYKQLQFFLNNGCTLDIINTESSKITLGLIMKNAQSRDRQTILKKIIKFCNLTTAITNGFNVIESLVAVHQGGQLLFQFYTEYIRMFMTMGCQLDQQNAKGETSLHVAVKHYNLEAISAILLLGVNMNVVNNNGETAFNTHTVCGYNSENPREAGSIEILTLHVWKMKLVGLEVHRSNEDAMNAVLKHYSLGPTIRIRCENELERLRQKSINEYLTMRNFLHGSTTVRKYPTMSFVERKIIDDFFKVNFLDETFFPELTGLLAMQYRIAQQRDELYQLAKLALIRICPVELPDRCLDRILLFFDNNELKKMIEVVQQI